MVRNDEAAAQGRRWIFYKTIKKRKSAFAVSSSGPENPFFQRSMTLVLDSAPCTGHEQGRFSIYGIGKCGLNLREIMRAGCFLNRSFRPVLLHCGGENVRIWKESFCRKESQREVGRKTRPPIQGDPTIINFGNINAQGKIPPSSPIQKGGIPLLGREEKGEIGRDKSGQ